MSLQCPMLVQIPLYVITNLCRIYEETKKDLESTVQLFVSFPKVTENKAYKLATLNSVMRCSQFHVTKYIFSTS